MIYIVVGFDSDRIDHILGVYDDVKMAEERRDETLYEWGSIEVRCYTLGERVDV